MKQHNITGPTDINGPNKKSPNNITTCNGQLTDGMEYRNGLEMILTTTHALIRII